MISNQIPETQLTYKSLIINITYRCNLKCPICYTSSPSSNKDLHINKISNIAKNYRKKVIVISGGEPTTRTDLPQIIKIINKQNVPFLATNGIKLVDYNYLLKLKKSGLKYILFSFNGFNDKIYKKINGRPLLKTKLKALKNIKKAKMKIILSVLLVRGVNDTEENLKKIFDYFIQNKFFIRELKIRVMSPIGRYENKKSYIMSELLDIICKSFRINKSDILNEIEYMKKIDDNFNRYSVKPCKIDFFFKIKNNKIIPLIQKNDLEKIDKSRFKKLILFYYTIKRFGIKTIFKQWLLENKLFDYKDMFIYGQNILKIGLRVWPNKLNIDLMENRKCRTGILQNNKFLPFCYANIITCG